VHTCTAVTLKKHENTFGIVSPTRTFYLQAKTHPEVQDWVRTINEAREAVQQLSTEGSTSSAPIPIPMSGRAPPTPSAPSLSYSPQGHGITSSESEEGSPTGTRSYPIPHTSPKPLPSAGPVKEGPKPLLSGYLMKCGSKRRIWHHRWFVLSGEKLAYSRSHMVILIFKKVFLDCQL
jgi:pleckstrin homology domain-containing family A member 1/2